MSEDESKKTEEDKDEVEGHRHHIAATDEVESDEPESDDEVEAHRHKMV